ncbi:FAD/NAD(P)-binding domain-containing protein [Biscogniauxia marginata]|nr:FAD/NAD(P)-binding domain-containing protein [Biscogniauxia marginata]
MDEPNPTIPSATNPNPSPRGHQIHVAIIGAGIAGCCLAVGLFRNPALDVHLYESHDGIGVRGAGLALHGNAIAAMDQISPAVKRAYFRKSHYMAGEEDLEMATSIILGSGKDAGTVVAELGRAKGRRTVHRAHFIQGLIEEEVEDSREDNRGKLAIPSERVHFRKRLVEIQHDDDDDDDNNSQGQGKKRITATFADGTAERFDVLFGAEGVSSVTRGYVLGKHHPAAEPVNHDGWRCFNVLVPMAEAAAALPRASIETVRMFCTPLGYVNGLPVDLGTTYSITCYQRDAKRPVAKRGGPFEAGEWKGFCREVDLLISLLEKNHPYEGWKIRDHDPAPTYVRGDAIAMIGDAAHATAPHAGNGAAQAIEDAAVLTGVFARVTTPDDVGPALRAFDAVRRPRSQRIVEITRRFGRLYSLDEGERDMPRMRAEMREGGVYTNGVDMQGQVRGAVEWFERERERGGV